MSQHYSDPSRENDPHALPDVEVFYVPEWFSETQPKPGERPTDSDGNYLPEGWYYWFCFPGCMPDSDAIGPFSTKAEAIASIDEAYLD